MTKRIRKLTLLLGLSVMLAFGTGRGAYAAEEPAGTQTAGPTEEQEQGNTDNTENTEPQTGGENTAPATETPAEPVTETPAEATEAAVEDSSQGQTEILPEEETAGTDLTEGTTQAPTEGTEETTAAAPQTEDTGNSGSGEGTETGTETSTEATETQTTVTTAEPETTGTTEVTEPGSEETTETGTTDPADPQDPGTGEPEQPAPIVSVRDMIHFIGETAAAHSSDAILIESNGRFGLIDASNPSNSSLGFNEKGMNGTVLAGYLKEIGVLHLDFILGTHAHSDHIGGIPELVRALNAEGQSFIDSTTVYIFKDYSYIKNEEVKKWYNGELVTRARKAVTSKGASLLDVNAPTEESLAPLGAVYETDERSALADRITFSFGDFEIRLFNLHKPSADNPEDMAYNKLGNENQNSIITLVTKAATETDPERRVLLTADMESSNHLEQDMTALIAEEFGTVDIMKAGHHGAFNAGSKEALDNMQPSIYVISKTLKTVNELPSYYYLTDKGTAIYYQNQQKMALVADLTGGEIEMKSYGVARQFGAKALQYVQTQGGFYSWYADKVTKDYYTFYVNADGTFATGWNKIGSSWYYFDENAHLTRGWQDIDGVRYFMDAATGVMKTGWQTIGGQKYYFNGSGAMQTGWQQITKTVIKTVKKKKVKTKVTNWYCFAEDGHMLKGWQHRGTSWSYLKSDGTAVTGKQTISKKTYYFNGAGVMRQGSFKIGKKTYFAGTDGAVGKGWKTHNGLKAYCKSDGTVTTGRAKIGTKYYFFNGSGILRTNAWVKIGKNYYYANENGAQVTGWKQMNGNWYYFKSSGVRATGKQTIGKKIYYFTNGGIMRTGSFTIGKVEYLVGDDGAVSSGWKEFIIRREPAETEENTGTDGTDSLATTDPALDAGTEGSIVGTEGTEPAADGDIVEIIRKYVKADGSVAKGSTKIGSTRYMFDGTGKLREGWVKYGGKWYYASDKGVAQTGWIRIDGKTYYFNASGAMVTGKQTISGKTYTFNSSGVLTKGKAPAVKATFTTEE